MNRIYHETYHSIAKDLDAEEREFARNYAHHINFNQNRSQSLLKKAMSSDRLAFFVSLVCILMVILVWYLYLTHPLRETGADLTQVQMPRATEVTTQPLRQNATERVEKELFVMKGVIQNLVETVDRLSQVRQEATTPSITTNSERVPNAFVIKTAKANLREYPSIDAGTIEIVEKDAVLANLGTSNDWIRTITPTGKSAWIHSSVVKEIGEASK